MAAGASWAGPHPAYGFELARVVLRAQWHTQEVLKKCDFLASPDCPLKKGPDGLVTEGAGGVAPLTEAFDALNYAAKVRNLLTGSGKSKASQDRAAWLRGELGIVLGSLPTIEVSYTDSVRNALEHFDERLDVARSVTAEPAPAGAWMFIDACLASRPTDYQGQPIQFLRVLFYTERKLVILATEVSLRSLAAELETVLAAVRRVAPDLTKLAEFGGALLSRPRPAEVPGAPGAGPSRLF